MLERFIRLRLIVLTLVSCGLCAIPSLSMSVPLKEVNLGVILTTQREDHCFIFGALGLSRAVETLRESWEKLVKRTIIIAGTAALVLPLRDGSCRNVAQSPSEPGADAGATPNAGPFSRSSGPSRKGVARLPLSAL